MAGTFLCPCLVAGLLLPAGCTQQRPYAAESGRPASDAETNWKGTLTAAEQADALAAMSLPAEGHQPASRPAPAPDGMRWSDIRPAVAAACTETEVAIVWTIDRGDELEYRLRTIEDWPGLLIVRRVADPETYEIIELTIGRFPDRPGRIARADALRAALGRQMLAFGRKRQFNDADED